MYLNQDEIRAIIPGVELVVSQAARDVAFFSEALVLGPNRDRVLTEIRTEVLNPAKAALRKLRKELES